MSVTDTERYNSVPFNSRSTIVCWDCGCDIAFRENSEPDTVYLLWCAGPTELALVATSYRMRPLCRECAAGLLSRRFVSEADCGECNRPIVYEVRHFHRKHVFCCEDHSRDFYNHRSNKRRKAVSALLRKKTCAVCGEEFAATRRDAKACSSACKQKAYRQRKKEGV